MKAKRASNRWAAPKPSARHDPHPADLHVGRQIASVRVHCNVSQAQLSREIGVSVHQLQKYENARNRVSASMMYEIGRSLGVTVSRFFAGLPENGDGARDALGLPFDERIGFITSAEGRRLIGCLIQLPPRVRARVSVLIAAIGEELNVSQPDDAEG